MTAPLPTRAALVARAAGDLAAAGIADPARDARLLMRWAAGLDGAGMAAGLDAPCPPDEAARFRVAAARRAARVPLSHITGTRAFWDRTFRVTPDVLDPRPETEVLVAEALQRGPFARVLDIGTGSGCLIVTLLAAWPGAEGWATDISAAALAVARRNAEDHGTARRTRFVETRWADGLAGPFDLIVSNPPYLAAAEIAALDPEVRDHEPRIALTPGGDGLDAYRAIAAAAGNLLVPGGWLMVEIGPHQAETAGALLAACGLAVQAVVPDLDRRPRVILARA